MAHNTWSIWIPIWLLLSAITFFSIYFILVTVISFLIYIIFFPDSKYHTFYVYIMLFSQISIWLSFWFYWYSRFIIDRPIDRLTIVCIHNHHSYLLWNLFYTICHTLLEYELHDRLYLFCSLLYFQWIAWCWNIIVTHLVIFFFYHVNI